jgi:hypothetical protein
MYVFFFLLNVTSFFPYHQFMFLFVLVYWQILELLVYLILHLLCYWILIHHIKLILGSILLLRLIFSSFLTFPGFEE